MEKSAVAEHAWENHHPIHYSAGPWQRTGAVGEGGPAHPHDTLKGELVDHCDEKAGRDEQLSLTFDLQ